jgi:hypothetical protein
MKLDELENLRDELGYDSKLVFEDFLGIVDHLDRASALRLRQKAGFSDDQREMLHALFSYYDKDKGGTLENEEIICIFNDLGIRVATQEHQSRLISKIAEARHLAKMSGVQEEDLAPAGACVITFPMLCHLVRTIRRERQRESITQEMAAMEETGFTDFEVAQFRDIFTDYMIDASTVPAMVDDDDDDDEEQVEEKSHAAAMLKVVIAPRGSESDDARITMQGVRLLIKTMGGKLQREDNEQLRDKVSKFKTSRNLGAAHGQSICFPDFLRMMRWMMKINFGDVNKLADKAVAEGATPVVQGSPTKSLPRSGSKKVLDFE